MILPCGGGGAFTHCEGSRPTPHTIYAWVKVFGVRCDVLTLSVAGIGWVIRLCSDDVRLGIGRGLSLDSPRVTGLSPVFGRMKEGLGERDMMKNRKKEKKDFNGYQRRNWLSLHKTQNPSGREWATRPKKRNERKTVKKPRTTPDVADGVPETHKVVKRSLRRRRYKGETTVRGKEEGKKGSSK